MVYMAQTAALAVLENLVHRSRQDYPTGYVVVSATIPDNIVTIDESRLRDPLGFHGQGERFVGDYWMEKRLSAVLHYLLNPLPVDFAQIAIHPPEEFVFDQRLFN